MNPPQVYMCSPSFSIRVADFDKNFKIPQNLQMYINNQTTASEESFDLIIVFSWLLSIIQI